MCAQAVGCSCSDAAKSCTYLAADGTTYYLPQNPASSVTPPQSPSSSVSPPVQDTSAAAACTQYGPAVQPAPVSAASDLGIALTTCGDNGNNVGAQKLVGDSGGVPHLPHYSSIHLPAADIDAHVMGEALRPCLSYSDRQAFQRCEQYSPQLHVLHMPFDTAALTDITVRGAQLILAGQLLVRRFQESQSAGGALQGTSTSSRSPPPHRRHAP